MAVGRILLKKVSGSHKLEKLKTHRARLLFSWLVPHADINGNFYAESKLIKSIVMPLLSVSCHKITQDVRDLSENGLIQVYSVLNRDYLHIIDFVKKQPNLRIDREKPDFPVNPNSCKRRESSGSGTGEVILSNTILSEEKGKDPFLANDNDTPRQKKLKETARKFDKGIHK